DGLLAPHRPLDDAPARALLNDATLPLFQGMSKVDQAHSLRLLAWLQAQGWTDPDLLHAALLHDCGKAAARVAVWQRTLKVLVKRLAPQQWGMLSRPARPGSWRYPFYILRTHPFRGALAARAAGCSETVAWLIEFHETDPDPTDLRHPLMRALQDADANS
ncbi:MAG: hypothetical protein HUU23_08275, partial [Caldilineales bacterium]|nr:hypothetical protein [Caldilineales bacterium]